MREGGREKGRERGREEGRKERNEIKSRHNKPMSSLKNCLNGKVGCQYVLVGSLLPFTLEYKIGKCKGERGIISAFLPSSISDMECGYLETVLPVMSGSTCSRR